MNAGVWNLIGVVEVPRPRRPRWALLVWLVALVLVLAGCDGPATPPFITPDACREACAPGVMRSASLRECTCFDAAGACTVDRLLVTPVPPGPKGRVRG
jgi:hypothetical protein